MAKKHSWCASTSHPVVVQIADKYNISRDDAKTIFNNAIDNDASLQEENIEFSYVDNSEAFQDALEAFVQKWVEDEDFFIKDVESEEQRKKNIIEEFREELETTLTQEESENIVNRLSEISKFNKLSRESTAHVVETMRAFSDPRHLDFLGTWVCKYLSEIITKIETDQSVRNRFNIEKQKNRQDYYLDNTSRNILYNCIKGTLKGAAEELEESGKKALADELNATIEHLPTIMFMYGGEIFRTEGVRIGPGETLATTTFENDSENRNETDPENGDDPEDPSESPTNSFSASDQNQSVTTKIVPDIKILLSSIHNTDRSGNEKTDPYGFGLHTYIDVPSAVNRLLATCMGCDSFSQMQSRLIGKTKSTPWINSLVNALDTSKEAEDSVLKSKKEQLQTMFFKSMRKQFTHLRASFLVRTKDGSLTIVNRDVNIHHHSDAMMKRIFSYFNMKEGLPLFKDGGIDFSFFGEAMKRISSLKTAIAEAEKEAKSIAAQRFTDGDKNISMAPATNRLIKITEDFQSILNDFGINATRDVIDSYLLDSEERTPDAGYWGTYEGYGDDDFRVATTRLKDLVSRLSSLNAKFSEWERHIKKKDSKDTAQTNPFKPSTSDWEDIRGIRNWYENIITRLSANSPDSFESRAHNNKKDYYSWNNPSTILTIIEKLSKTDKDAVQKYIRDKYCKDSVWFLRPDSKPNEPHFYSDWLEDIYYGRGRETIAYSEKLSVGGEEYSDMSDVSYSLSILSDFFSPIRTKKDKAWYRMLIASDKPRYSSVLFTRHSARSEDAAGRLTEADFRTIIARKSIDFLSQEMNRCIDVLKASQKKGVTVDKYDPKIDDSNRHVFDKIKNKERVTVEDVLKDGKYIFEGSGLSFYINKYIVNEIEKKTELGKYIVDKVFNYKLHTKEKLIDESAFPLIISDEFEEDGKTRKGAFHKYMDKLRDSSFDFLDSIGAFTDKVVTVQDEDGDNYKVAHKEYLLGNLDAWHAEDADASNFRALMYSKKDEALAFAKEKYGYDFTQDKEVSRRQAFCELLQFRKDLQEFIYNNWLAKANMSEIFDVDLAFYGDTTNFQKRNAQVISAGYVTDKEAKIHGDLVSDGKYRSFVLKTNKVQSRDWTNLEVLFEKTADTISDERQRAQFQENARITLDKLKEIDPTDGQSYCSLTSLRKHLAGQGEWSRSETKKLDEDGYYLDDTKHKVVYIYTDEAVYRRMKRGYKTDIDKGAKVNDLLHVFGQIQKPFVYGFTDLHRSNGRNMTLPVQHKNSEYPLIAAAYFTQAQPNSIVDAVARFMEETAEDNIRTGVDTAHFDSVVKIGGTSAVIDLDSEIKKRLKKLGAKDAYDGKNYIVGDKTILKSQLEAQLTLETLREYKDKPGYITEYDSTDYKIVQQKPEHFKHGTQPIGSQLKILSISNINDDATITLPNGKTITGKQLKTGYMSALRKKIEKSFDSFNRELGLGLPAASRTSAISYALKNWMSTDQKFSSDMRRALSVTEKDGQTRFILPLDEAAAQPSIEATIFSKIRQTLYKAKTPGGIVVQASSWGAARDLHIRFYSTNPEDKARGGVVPTLEEFTRENNYGKDSEKKYKEYCKKWQAGYAWFECEIPMPDYVKDLLRGEDGYVKSKYFNKDGSWNMSEIRKTVPESVFDAICYRVPTEAKYSIMACKVVRFAKEGTSVAKYPLDLTEFTGSDFDIDTDFIEIRPQKGAADEAIDNQIFDYQLAALRAQGSVQETFRPGDFSDVSELSYQVTLLRAGYDKDMVMSLNKKKLKALCTQVENLDLMDLKSDILLRNQNMVAKDMIAIAAVGVTSHAFLSLFNNENDTDIHNKMRVTISEGSSVSQCKAFTVINDKSNATTELYVGGEVILDPVYDMDSKLVSTEISKYVGASADAAKDAALYRLNITDKTLPILIFMHRLGISSDIARLFISQPVVREVTKLLNAGSAFSNTMSIEDACRIIIDSIPDGKTMWNDITHSRDNTLVYSELLEGVTNDDAENREFGYEDLKYLHILMSLNESANSVKNLDSFTRYNSSKAMKGSSFITRFVTTRRLEKLYSKLIQDDAIIQLPDNVKILKGFDDNAYGKLCSMFPYVAATILGEQELTDKLILDNMHTYSRAFFEIADIFFNGEFDGSQNEAILRELYSGWKNYLLFVGDSRIADFTDKKTAERYTKNYAAEFFRTLEDIKVNKPEIYNDVIKDNTFIDSIHAVTSKEGYANFTLLSTDITGIKDAKLETYQKDWESLLKYPETKKLAVDSAIHFLARSAAFSRDTPVILMPLAVKEAIPNYINAFEKADRVSFTDDQIMQFITLFQRNNTDNKAIVPHFKYNETTKNISVEPMEGATDEYPIVAVTVKPNKVYGLSNLIYRDDDENALVRLPVIKVVGAPEGDRLIALDPGTAAEIGKDAVDNEGTLTFAGILVTDLGIPNQMSEYVGYQDFSKSLFEESEEEAAEEAKLPADERREPAEISASNLPPFVYPEGTTELINDNLFWGRRVGTFLDINPFGSAEIDAGYNKLAKDATSYSGNPYLESRVTLRRIGKIADALHLKASEINRGYSGTKLRNQEYIINVTPSFSLTDLREKYEYKNTSEEAEKLAALCSGFGDIKAVQTYVPSMEQADFVEYTIKLASVVDEKTIIDTLTKAGIDNYHVNASKKEVSILGSPVSHTKTADKRNYTDIQKTLKKINSAISKLKKAGIGTAEDIEINFIQQNQDVDFENILNDFIYGTEQATGAVESGTAKPSAAISESKNREQKWLKSLAESTKRALNGEKVNSEFKEIFNEYTKPLKSVESSYTSYTLTDSVIQSINENGDLVSDIGNLLQEAADRKLSPRETVNNTILNVANWIRGNRPKDILTTALQGKGFSEENAEKIFTIIDSRLKELDIC